MQRNIKYIDVTFRVPREGYRTLLENLSQVEPGMMSNIQEFEAHQTVNAIIQEIIGTINTKFIKDKLINKNFLWICPHCNKENYESIPQGNINVYSCRNCKKTFEKKSL